MININANILSGILGRSGGGGVAQTITLQNIDKTSFDLTSNPIGTLYYSVLPAASSQPSIADIKAGTGSSAYGKFTNWGGEKTVNVTGLTGSTGYKVWWFITQLLCLNSAVKSSDLTTAANAIAPQITSIKVVNVGSKLEVTFNKQMADPSGKHAQFSLGKKTISSAALKTGDSKTIVLSLSATYFKYEGGDTLTYTAGDVSSSDGGLLQSQAVAFTNDLVGLQYKSNYITGYKDCIAVDSNYIYAIKASDSKLARLNKTTLEEVSTLTISGTPIQMCIDTVNNILLYTKTSPNIGRVNLTSFTAMTDLAGEAGQNYTAVAVDNTNGLLFVSHSASIKIRVYNYPAMTLNRDITTGPAASNSSGYSLHFDSVNNELYYTAITYSANQGIYKIQLSSDSIVKVISIASFGFGIDVANNKLIVSLNSNTGENIILYSLSDSGYIRRFSETSYYPRQIVADNGKYYAALITSSQIGLIG